MCKRKDGGQAYQIVGSSYIYTPYTLYFIHFKYLAQSIG